MNSEVPDFELAPAARADLEEIRDYIGRDSPRNASRHIERIKKRFQMLSRQPLIGEACDEIHKGYRRVSVGNYVVYYQVHSGIVRVIRVIHGARDVEAIFGAPDDESSPT